MDETRRVDKAPPTPPILQPALDPESQAAAGTRRLHRPHLRHGLLVLAGVTLAVLVFDFALRHQWPLPGCPFERLTGHPCAFCEGCRTVALLGSAHPLQALLANPFVALMVMGASAWGGALVCDGLIGSNLHDRLLDRIRQLPWLRFLVSAILLNWFYLLVRVH